MSISHSRIAVTIPCPTAARAENAIHVSCARKGFAKLVLKIRSSTRPACHAAALKADEKRLRSHEARAANRDRDRRRAGRDCVCETLVRDEIDSATKIDIHTAAASINHCARRFG